MKQGLLISLVLLLFSCQKPEPSVQEFAYKSGVFICNEGNFTVGNASLSIYDPDTRTVEQEVFFRANNLPIGDVLHSIAIEDSTAYLIVNNSSKIILMDPINMSYRGVIGGLGNPREIHFLEDGKAVVSDLYQSKIFLVDLIRQNVLRTEDVGHPSDGWVADGEYLYSNSWYRDSALLKIDKHSLRLVDSLILPYQPESMALDKNHKLWVLSDGGNASTPIREHPALSRVNLRGFEIEQTLSFPSSDMRLSHLQSTTAGDTLYYLLQGNVEKRNGLYAMAISEAELPAYPTIPAGDALFYNYHLPAEESDIYIADAVNFISPGKVYIYNRSGEALDTIAAGIIPSEILLW